MRPVVKKGIGQVYTKGALVLCAYRLTPGLSKTVKMIVLYVFVPQQVELHDPLKNADPWTEKHCTRPSYEKNETKFEYLFLFAQVFIQAET